MANYPTYDANKKAFANCSIGIPCRLIPKSGQGQEWLCWRADIRAHRPFVPAWTPEKDLACAVDIRKYNIIIP